MDGGVGEMALYSAAIGAASGAYRAHSNGGNMWTGALAGGALGAAGGAAGSALSGMGGAAADATGNAIADSTVQGSVGSDVGLSSIPSANISSTAPVTSDAGLNASTTSAVNGGVAPSQAAQYSNPGTYGPATPQSQAAINPGQNGIGNSLLQGTDTNSTLGLNSYNPNLAAPDNPLSQAQVDKLGSTSLNNTASTNPFSEGANWAEAHKGALGLGAMGIASMLSNRKFGNPTNTQYTGPLSKYRFTPSANGGTFTQSPTFNLASGGLPSLAKGEARGETLRGTMGQLHGVERLTTYAKGGIPRLLKGPGDGMSDSIPATIDDKQPARLADGEFVIPADVVSHLGNGSTDAGAKQLYSMMSRIRKARTGNSKQGKQIDPSKFLK